MTIKIKHLYLFLLFFLSASISQAADIERSQTNINVSQSSESPALQRSIQQKQSIAPHQACQNSIKMGNYQVALAECSRQLEKLEESAESQNRDTDRLYIYLSLVDIYHSLGEAPKESEYLSLIRQDQNFNQSPHIKYQWHRRMGQKLYFNKELEPARFHLYQALEIAEHENDSIMLAKSYNDVGLVESQLGNFRQSLQHYQQSLKIKLKNGDAYAVGTTLNNIGLIYSKLENTQQAIVYYEQALDNFLEYTRLDNFDRRVFDNITHVYEDLAISYSQMDDKQKENFYQKKAVDNIELKNSVGEQVRVLVNIARIQLEDNQLNSAKSFLEKAMLLQPESNFDLRSELNLNWALYYLKTGENDQAISHANSALIAAEENDDLSLQEKIYRILSDAYRVKDLKAAFHFLEKHAEKREAFLSQKYDSEIKSIQVTIEKQQVEHQLALEQIENANNQTEIQRLTNEALTVTIMLILSISFIVFYWFKKHKEKQSLLQSIKYHQQQLILLDDKFQQQDLRKLDISSTNDHLLKNENEPPTITQKPLNSETPEEIVNHDTLDIQKYRLRQALVNTMVEAVSIWESHTGTNRVELAEKSKIWTVSIDNGSLRTRSLDKYLSLEKIPKNPRWRNVAGTCHFILSDASLPAEARTTLNNCLDSVMQSVKSLSLGSETN
ncbi:tetratricopeptide repeat protein [Aliikangiella sp. G2MR2-5]|uniref:tetratricopeptide repeat protein n=1 Tax=Aliikangiella sp. G2MR2-5 TaxID=2788943 RepID=UPI001AEDA4A4|nr:tetratricopeptide repeat protein [Aliikangiella sp. G2MR2-5]